MDKKFISTLLSVAIIASTTSVFADTINEEISTLTGVTSGTDVIFNHVDGSTLILNGYNNNGELVYSTTQAVPIKQLQYQMKFLTMN